MNKIFLQFSTFYGQIWRSQFKNEYYTNFARNSWSEALQEYDETLIEQVIADCLKNREMPPTLSQFIECCKQKNKKHHFFKREPYQPGDPKVAHAYLKKIKQMLNMKSK